ncbi:hypothetical protein [Paenibacillus yanchengensis]|uniref:Uncharacterized protein n=1 Tax=Paenibacillus yanchengensis TaxID=2035833 RepID=A0ABW4YL05_9BACL
MKLRTVIYSGKVEINNVPVYSCDSCQHSEVIPEVKTDLTSLLAQLGNKPPKQSFLFNECNEWADLLVEAKEKTKKLTETDVAVLTESRVNALLDLFLLAQSLQNDEWMEDITKRLEQLSRSKQLT